MQKGKKIDTKNIVIIGMMSALSFVSVALIRIPVVSFLDYEPKDVFMAIAGFIFGPLCALIMSVAVSLIEMVTISDTGIIGFVMNALSSVAFCCTAAVFYYKKRTMKSAIAGLITGAVAATAVMLLWNYLITPIYMNLPRAEVAKMLLPIFLPFNVIKYGINTALTLLLYKSVVTALRKARLLPKSEYISDGKKVFFKAPVIILSVVIIASCVLLYLVINNYI